MAGQVMGRDLHVEPGLSLRPVALAPGETWGTQHLKGDPRLISSMEGCCQGTRAEEGQAQRPGGQEVDVVVCGVSGKAGAPGDEAR